MSGWSDDESTPAVSKTQTQNDGAWGGDSGENKGYDRDGGENRGRGRGRGK